MNVEINTTEVLKAGEEHFPALAIRLKTVSKMMHSSQSKHLAKALAGMGIQKTWSNYHARISMAIGLSGMHLEHCGEVLTEVVKEHDGVDEENAFNIEDPFTGNVRDAEDVFYEKR